jgi:FkbM family methyltransferase
LNSLPLLSIAIPAYDRPKELKFSLTRLISQIRNKYEEEVELIISDDCSPNDSLAEIRRMADCYKFMTYRRYPKNIGLERNLISCADICRGEFLWILGDDDFIESDDGLDHIMTLLRNNHYDFYVFNRTRRSFNLSKLLTNNWMNLNVNKSYEFNGLRAFCVEHGFISIIGFISVNIFRREPFQGVDVSKYFGTMYPQLGAMLEAFFDRKTILIGRPLICHRTPTQQEKKATLGKKPTEADFMADVDRRYAIYFSHPYVAMLDELVKKGVFTPAEIVRIPENTVINGLLIDFLIQTVTLSHEMNLEVSPENWARTAKFFDILPLGSKRRRKIDAVLSSHANSAEPVVHSAASPVQTEHTRLSISVITPSYNQAEFLDECLASVRDQTYKPTEHIVFDPGSEDDSRAVAASFPHVTLIAEPDEGQSDALNKGFRLAQGDIIAWINSDDYFANRYVFERIVNRFLEPDAPDIVYGKGIYVNESGKKLRDVYVNKNPASLPWRFQQEDGILQPALFMRRSVVEKVGPLRNDLHYSMDYEYWIRCMKAGMKFSYIDEDLAVARYHINNKTYGMRGKSYLEVCDMLKEHFGYVNHIWLRRYAEFLAEGYDGVLAHSSNMGIKDQTKLDAINCELLTAYNTSHDTYRLLVERATEIGYGDTLREMKSLNISPTVPCKEIPLEQAQEAGYVAYTVGERRWAFDSKWKSSQIAKTHEFFRRQIAARSRDTCVIVGNGPSLNNTNLSLLKNQDVIISNNAFLSKQLLKYATYYTVVNYLVAEQSDHHINTLQHVHKIIPYWLAYCLNPGANTYFVDAIGRPEFSKDIFKNMSWRHTVTFFNLHLAYGLGYRRVIMIGFDHNYKQPKDVVEQEVIHSFETDENHFHPDYFRGKKWQAADVDMMEEMYRLAKSAFEEDGREIINSTVGGKLELFPRLPLDEALGLTPEGHGKEPIFAPDNMHSSQEYTLIRPFSRDESAHCNETGIIAALFRNTLVDSTMIDVGAHYGSELMPFLNMGWQIFAFEPDDKNRQKLLDSVMTHKNAALINIDSHALSNESKQGLPYYRSKVSTGISGLSAFHQSHQEVQQVDTVTLTEFFKDKVLASVGFLKIDTEGHDLMVLQGFPWERFKPEVIECEFEDSKTVPLGYTFHDIASYLVEKEYIVLVSEWHPIIRYGIKHDWRTLMRYPCNLSNNNGWGNLIAFKEEETANLFVDKLAQSIKTKSNKQNFEKPKGLSTPDKKVAIKNPIKNPFALPATKKAGVHVINIIKLKFQGLWFGLMISIILALYGLSSLPGATLAAFLAVLPFFIAWRQRMIKLFGSYQDKHEEEITALETQINALRKR